MTVAVLCSGQGLQHQAMFALTEDAPEAAPVFATAARMLGGHDPRDLVRGAGPDAIQGNLVGQLLCCTQALAAHAALREALGAQVVYAGYSVGEVASWCCAGLLDADATLALTARRATLMDDSSGPDDGMAFVRGLPHDAVRALCARLEVGIAIVNPADGFVVAGTRARLDGFCAAALQAGAGRAGLLGVQVASHSPALAAAARHFRAAIRDAKPAPAVRPGARLLSGIDGGTVFASEAGADKLALQISQTVQWASCLDACLEAGASAMLELGPGHALAGMAARIDADVEVRSLDAFRSLDGVRHWLARFARSR